LKYFSIHERTDGPLTQCIDGVGRGVLPLALVPWNCRVGELQVCGGK